MGRYFSGGLWRNAVLKTGIRPGVTHDARCVALLSDMADATAKLSTAQRELLQADVIYFAAAPTTGTFFDDLTAVMLSAPTSMRYMAQARDILEPGQYAEAQGIAAAAATPPASLTQLLLPMPYTVSEAMRDIRTAANELGLLNTGGIERSTAAASSTR